MIVMLSVVIQAGGRSSRMGKDKALVLLDGRPLVEYVITSAAGLGAETLITTNSPAQLARFGLPLVSDPVPGAGALFGLQTALHAASGSHILLIACDMPFLQRPVLEDLAALAPQADVVAPVIEGRFEPVLATYSRVRCLQAVERALEAGERRMISFFPQVEILALDEPHLRSLDPELISFFNINTPEDLHRAEAMLASGQVHPINPPDGGNQHDI
jgi:molybdopterin-guanine dinucleotide biosynthesis protein A